eukprot:scaffold51788_cov59-Phaeocystis_antarctica.AAC.5
MCASDAPSRRTSLAIWSAAPAFHRVYIHFFSLRPAWSVLRVPGYRVALSGFELRREYAGRAMPARGAGAAARAVRGTCIDTPDCDARDGGGPHALTRVWRGSTGPGGSPKSPPKILLTPQSW